jgi:hypothetical protein
MGAKLDILDKLTNILSKKLNLFLQKLLIHNRQVDKIRRIFISITKVT